MYDLITYGDITIDLFFKGKTLTQDKDRFALAIGGKYQADSFYESLGGGGANVAAGVAHFGFKTAVFGRVGNNPFKQMILQKLLGRHVASEFIIEKENYLNLSSILLTEEGERTIIHYVSSNEPLTVPEKYEKRLVQTKMMYMGNMPDTTLSEKIRILNFYKKNNITICLNIGIADCRLPLAKIIELIRLADIFVVNTHEFAELVKKEVKEIDFKENCLPYLKNDKTTLFVTDSTNGSYGYNRSNVYFQKPIDKGKRIDATGAGDAYVSGLVSAYLENLPIQKAMIQASNYAGLKITRIGAQ